MKKDNGLLPTGTGTGILPKVKVAAQKPPHFLNFSCWQNTAPLPNSPQHPLARKKKRNKYRMCRPRPEVTMK